MCARAVVVTFWRHLLSSLVLLSALIPVNGTNQGGFVLDRVFFLLSFGLLSFVAASTVACVEHSNVFNAQSIPRVPETLSRVPKSAPDLTVLRE